ncbi:MAG: ABC transporter permease [Anaerolineae bacterium]
MMISPRWRKVLRDLWANKTRTLLVVLSIAVGVFAVGTVAHMQVIVSDDLDASYAAISPASATLQTAQPFDDDLVETIRRMPEVAEAEGRRGIVVRFKTGPDEEWHPLLLYALADYDDIRINKVRQEVRFDPDPDNWPTGNWPPPERELVLERTSLLMAQLGLTRSKLGDTLIIKTPAGKERSVPITGLAYDFGRVPATFSGLAIGYVTFDTMEWLGGPHTFNELHIIVAEKADDVDHIQWVAERVKSKIEKSGRNVPVMQIHQPGKLPLDNYFQAISLILGALGFLSLFLSGFLVVNTISALLAQQIRQIGVMKAIGAGAGQLMVMYLALVMIFGLLALLLGVPMGVEGARNFVGFLSYFLNFQLSSFTVPPKVVMFEAAMGLLVPLLAALYPVIKGTRATVREAISEYGLGKGQFGTSVIDRLLVQLQRLVLLPRPLLLSLRNTFRRKMRLVLTLLTLTLASAIFVGVFSVRASLFLTIDNVLQYWQYDVQLQFEQPYRIERLEREALRLPGVVQAESWIQTGANRQRPDGSEGQGIALTGLPADTRMFRPVVLKGRWLLPGDQNALVLSSDVLEDEPDLKVGDTVTLKIGDRETEWQIAGVVQGILAMPFAYTNYPYLARTLGDVGQVSSVQLVTDRHGAAYQTEMAQQLQEHFEAAGLAVTSALTSSQQREQIGVLFNILTSFLFSMAVLLAAVGGLGLMGTMSLNVLERTREIGVMRAIGAADETVLQIVIVEGVIIGLLSWLLGTVLALPLGKLLSDAVGAQFLRFPLSYTFSMRGMVIWLALVVLLAALASYLPAQHASRLTVREVLAYE